MAKGGNETQAARVGIGSVYRNAIVTVLALILCVAWAGFAGFILFIPAGGRAIPKPEIIGNAFVVVGPVILIWLVAALYKLSRNTKEDIWALHAEIGALRADPASGTYADGYSETASEDVHEDPWETAAPEPIHEPMPEAPDAGAVADEADPADPDPAPQAEAALPLATVIRALSFANDDDDTEGFEAVDRAMDDERIAGILDASQRVLHRLAEIDIFMDNLTPDIASPEVWRLHAANAGDSEISTLGGIAETNVLEQVSRLLEEDQEFREQASLMMRGINEQMLHIIGTADDDQILQFACSRTVLAFILLGNVAG